VPTERIKKRTMNISTPFQTENRTLRSQELVDIYPCVTKSRRQYRLQYQDTQALPNIASCPFHEVYSITGATKVVVGAAAIATIATIFVASSGVPAATISAWAA
jgi:hypothetical protein